MSILKLLGTRRGLQLAILFVWLLPRALAYRLGAVLAAYAAGRRDLPLVRTLAANLGVVLGLPVDHPAVREGVTGQLTNTLLCAIDLFKITQAGPEAVRAACSLDRRLLDTVEGLRDSGRGVLLVGAHTCGFDMALLALGHHFPSVQAMSNAQPTGSMAVMNELRARHGVGMTPINVRSLRQALARLRNGGLVAIAADLPLESGVALTFFGRPARLPVGHARLAISSGAAMLVGTSRRVGDGRYVVEGVRVPRPASTGDRQRDVTEWAQSALAALEKQIGRCPEQWMMPLPLWEGESGGERRRAREGGRTRGGNSAASVAMKHG